MSLIAGRGCRWPPRRDSVSPCAPLSGGRDTHDGHENSPILVFFSNLLDRDPQRWLDRRNWISNESGRQQYLWRAVDEDGNTLRTLSETCVSPPSTRARVGAGAVRRRWLSRRPCGVRP